MIKTLKLGFFFKSEQIVQIYFIICLVDDINPVHFLVEFAFFPDLPH